MTVAIVENEFITQLHLELALTKMGHKVIGTAANYNDGLVLISDNNPDIILLDISLDGKKNGIDLAQYINKNGKKNIIYITGNTDKDTRNKILNTSFLGIIEKPFETLKFNKLFTDILSSFNL